MYERDPLERERPSGESPFSNPNSGDMKQPPDPAPPPLIGLSLRCLRKPQFSSSLISPFPPVAHLWVASGFVARFLSNSLPYVMVNGYDLLCFDKSACGETHPPRFLSNPCLLQQIVSNFGDLLLYDQDFQGFTRIPFVATLRSVPKIGVLWILRIYLRRSRAIMTILEGGRLRPSPVFVHDCQAILFHLSGEFVLCFLVFLLWYWLRVAFISILLAIWNGHLGCLFKSCSLWCFLHCTLPFYLMVVSVCLLMSEPCSPFSLNSSSNGSGTIMKDSVPSSHTSAHSSNPSLLDGDGPNNPDQTPEPVGPTVFDTLKPGVGGHGCRINLTVESQSVFQVGTLAPTRVLPLGDLSSLADQLTVPASKLPSPDSLPSGREFVACCLLGNPQLSTPCLFSTNLTYDTFMVVWHFDAGFCASPWLQAHWPDNISETSGRVLGTRSNLMVQEPLMLIIPFSFGSRPSLMPLQASNRVSDIQDQVLSNSTFMFWLYFDMCWVYMIAFLPLSIVLFQVVSWFYEVLDYLVYGCSLCFEWFVAQHGCVLGPCRTAHEQHPPMLGLARRGTGNIYLPCIFVVSHHGMAGSCIIALVRHRTMLEITQNGFGQCKKAPVWQFNLPRNAIWIIDQDFSSIEIHLELLFRLYFIASPFGSNLACMAIWSILYDQILNISAK